MLNRLIATAGAISLLSSGTAFALPLTADVTANSSTSSSASSTMTKKESKERIKNLRNSVRELKEIAKKNNRSYRKNTEVKVGASADIACVKTEVTQRETALVGALTTYMDGWKAALLKRQTSLEAAWSITVEADRNVAIKAAWTVYVTNTMNARKVYQDAKKAAWKSFRDDVKATCKATAEIDVSGEDMDEIDD